MKLFHKFSFFTVFVPIEQEDVEANEVILSEETIAFAASESFAVPTTSRITPIPSSSKRIRSPLPILATGPSITPTNGGFNGQSRNLFIKFI